LALKVQNVFFFFFFEKCPCSALKAWFWDAAGRYFVTKSLPKGFLYYVLVQRPLYQR
jgi:hypothetical protein